MTIFGREPAAWIGLIATIILAVVSILNEDGVINDAFAGRVENAVDGTIEILTILAPLITGLLIRAGVTPTAHPVLPAGTPVETPEGAPATVVSSRTV